jgi:hypothetical protein
MVVDRYDHKTGGTRYVPVSVEMYDFGPYEFGRLRRRWNAG